MPVDLDQTALTGAVGSRSTLVVQERLQHYRRRQNQTTCVVIGVTVNLEIFARVYFCESSNMQSFVCAKFRENKILITLSFTDIGESCPSHEF